MAKDTKSKKARLQTFMFTVKAQVRSSANLTDAILAAVESIEMEGLESLKANRPVYDKVECARCDVIARPADMYLWNGEYICDQCLRDALTATEESP